MTELLISKEDVARYFHIARGREEQSFNQYIREAQEFDFKPLVCEEFYYALINRIKEERIQRLLHGFTYEHQGQKIAFEGLRYILAHFTYAGYLLKSNINDTPFGIVHKSNEYSLMVDYNERDRLYKRYRAQAFLLTEDFKKCLERHKMEYPEWQACKEGTSSKEKKRTNYQFTVLR